MQQTALKICKLLGINTQEYSQYQYDCAVDWLLHHLHNDTEVVDDVMQTTVFWKWWSIHVYHRDNDWLKVSYNDGAERGRLLNDWLYYHSSDRLCNLNTKHGSILFNSYANINWKEDGTSHI